MRGEIKNERMQFQLKKMRNCFYQNSVNFNSFQELLLLSRQCLYQFNNFRKAPQKLKMSTTQEQTPYHQQFDYNQQAIIEQVLRLSLEVQNTKTFSKANGLSHKYVKLIKTMKMGKSKQKCTICIQGFCLDECIKRFPCGHIFHSRCAKDWLKVNKRCPLCRIDLQEHFLMLENASVSKEVLS